MFEVGDLVLLKTDHEYSRGKSNPIGIPGTIVMFNDKDGLPVHVKWDNGCYNTYKRTDLIKGSKLHRYLFEAENATV